MPNFSQSDAIEQTRALGHELGIPMDRLMDQVGKALGIPRDLESDPHFETQDKLEQPGFQPGPEKHRETGETEEQSLPETSLPDSGQVSSGLLERPKRKCRELNKQGQPCGAYRLKGGDLCLVHESDAVTNFRDAQSRGGQADRKPVSEELPLLDFNLLDRAGIQAVLGQIVRMHLLGALPSRQVSQLVKLFGLVVANARNMPLPVEERRRFTASNDMVQELSDLIVDRLHARDLADRTNAIADHRAKREEVLRANESFGYLPPTKTKPATQHRTPQIGYGPNDIRPFHG